MNARRAGFTLIELVITIVVVGVISIAVGAFLLPMLNSYQGVERRAALAESADSAIRRMSRDVRLSLPNSVRVTTTLAVGAGFAIEMIPTADGARYCTDATADCDAAGALTIGNPDTILDVLGCFRNATFAPLTIAAPLATSAYRLVVGSTDSNIYTATGASAVIAPAGSVTLSIFPGTGGTPTVCGTASGTATTFNRHRITFTSHTFPTASPRQRLFIVEEVAAPVTYICNQTAGTITRYVGYRDGAALSTASQPTDPGAAPLNTVTGRLVANKVGGCSAASTEANVQTSGVVTLSLTLSDSGESVQLINQVQLDNSQ
jgi:MSHA biogenesis protein MshO